MKTITYKLNPVFVVALLFCAGVGYLIGETRGAVWGAVGFMCFSFLISIIDAWVNRGKSKYERAIDDLRDFYRK